MRNAGSESPEAGQLLPARMLNEYAYCPRLFHLEWVQGEFADNHFTVEGRTAHRAVDARSGAPPSPETEQPFTVRSVSLSSERLGVSGKIDLIESEGGGKVAPVDYKRGRAPGRPEGAYEPELVQLCLYGLLLREHGYRCDEGLLYFVESRQRVIVPISEALVERTLELLREARRVAAQPELPPPLVGSPKCQGCSLHGICLPDETNRLRGAVDPSTVRRLLPALDDARPLYVNQQGARVGLNGQTLEVRDREGRVLAQEPLIDVSQLVIFGNVQVSTQAVRELCEREIPMCWMTFGGWLSGLTEGVGHSNVEVRRAQFRIADDPLRSLALAKRFVRGKLANSRTLLRRNGAAESEKALNQLAFLRKGIDGAASSQELLGIEGNAARIYFEAFPAMLRPREGTPPLTFDFKTRSRRPPKDPVNALLSLTYSLLAKDFTVAARSVGLDPFLGFYHQPRFGRPALALDLMEEFRSVIADSVVLFLVNTGTVRAEDFIQTALGTTLRPDARKRVIRDYERRMAEEVTHPLFGYRVSYRRVLEVQCRLLARHLVGELDAYPEFRTR